MRNEREKKERNRSNGGKSILIFSFNDLFSSKLGIFKHSVGGDWYNRSLLHAVITASLSYSNSHPRGESSR